MNLSVQAASSRHVLIVEDNADIRESLQIILEMEGHRVDVAENGKQALELVNSKTPEVALIDIGLPELDGFEVAEQLRTTGFAEKMFLIAMTGHGEVADRKRAFAAGFNAHIVKPPDQDRLLKLLTTLDPQDA